MLELLRSLHRIAPKTGGCTKIVLGFKHFLKYRCYLMYDPKTKNIYTVFEQSFQLCYLQMYYFLFALLNTIAEVHRILIDCT